MTRAKLLVRIRKDYADLSLEGWTQAGLLRTVVALNEEATLDDVREALADKDIHPGTLANRFRESRKVSAELDALL